MKLVLLFALFFAAFLALSSVAATRKARCHGHHQGPHHRPRPRRQRDADRQFDQYSNNATPTTTPTTTTTATTTATVAGLDRALAKAVQTDGLQAPSAGEAVPHDDTEVKHLMEGVVRRINVRSAMDLTLVSVESVRKTVDRDKMLRYQADVSVYSKKTSSGFKLAAMVDVMPSGKSYVRELRVHGAAPDRGDGPAASNGNGFQERYATFEPAIRY